MFTRVKMSAEEEIHRRVYVNVVQSQTEKGNNRKNVYAARRSRKLKIEFHVNTVHNFCIQQMLIILAQGR